MCVLYAYAADHSKIVETMFSALSILKVKTAIFILAENSKNKVIREDSMSYDEVQTL